MVIKALKPIEIIEIMNLASSRLEISATALVQHLREGLWLHDLKTQLSKAVRRTFCGKADKGEERVRS